MSLASSELAMRRAKVVEETRALHAALLSRFISPAILPPESNPAVQQHATRTHPDPPTSHTSSIREELDRHNARFLAQHVELEINEDERRARRIREAKAAIQADLREALAGYEATRGQMEDLMAVQKKSSTDLAAAQRALKDKEEQLAILQVQLHETRHYAETLRTEVKELAALSQRQEARRQRRSEQEMAELNALRKERNELHLRVLALEDARRRADEGRERAESEKKEALDGRQRAEEDARHTREQRQQLLEEKRRAEEAVRLADEAKKKALDELERRTHMYQALRLEVASAKRKEEKLRQRAEKAETKLVKVMQEPRGSVDESRSREDRALIAELEGRAALRKEAQQKDDEIARLRRLIEEERAPPPNGRSGVAQDRESAALRSHLHRSEAALASAREALAAAEASSEAEVAQLTQQLQEKQEIITNTVAEMAHLNEQIATERSRRVEAERHLAELREATEKIRSGKEEHRVALEAEKSARQSASEAIEQERRAREDLQAQWETERKAVERERSAHSEERRVATEKTSKLTEENKRLAAALAEAQQRISGAETSLLFAEENAKRAQEEERRAQAAAAQASKQVQQLETSLREQVKKANDSAVEEALKREAELQRLLMDTTEKLNTAQKEATDAVTTLTAAQEMIAALESLSKNEQEERMKISFEASLAAAAWKETEARLVREKQELTLKNEALESEAHRMNAETAKFIELAEEAREHEARLNKRVTALEEELKAKQAALEIAKQSSQSAADVAAEMERLSRELQAKEQTNKDTAAALANLQHLNSEKEQKLATSIREAAQAAHALEAAKASIQALENASRSSSAEYDARVRELRQESEQLTAKLAAAESKCASVTRERDDLAVQLASAAAQDKTRDAHSERDAAMQALAIFRHETNSLREALAQREASVTQLQRELTEHDAERRALAEQVRKAEASEQELRSQLAEKTRQYSASERKQKEEFDAAQAQITGLTLRAMQFEAAIAKKDEEHAGQHSKHTDGIVMLEKRLSEVQAELQNKQETLEARDVAVATLEKKVKKQEEELSRKSSESSSGSEALRELEKQLQMQTEMLAVATKQQEDSAAERGRVHELEAQVEQLRRENMEKDEKFAALRTANANAQEHVVALEAELRRTSAEAAERMQKFADENCAIQEALAAEPSLVAPLGELLRGVQLDPALLARVAALDEASAAQQSKKNGSAAPTASQPPSEFWHQLLDEDSIVGGEESEERAARVGSPLVRIGVAPKQPFKMVHLSSPIHPHTDT